MGDIVEPLGIQFKNPLPLLWQHKSDSPVGTVKLQKPTADGVPFEARLPNVTEPGRLKDRVDEAWQSIKLGLVRAVSIGFRSLEMSFMDDGGIRFLQSEVLELSLVTIPANQSATIDEIKSIDHELMRRAAPGPQAAQPPGATGRVRTIIKPKEAVLKTLAEQIAAFENTRAAKVARMTEIMTKAAEAGETLDQELSDEYDTLEAEVQAVDDHLKRLRTLEVTNRAAAVTVDGTGTEVAATSRSTALMARSGVTQGVRSVSVRANVPKGTTFTRYAMCIAAAKGNRWEAHQMAKANANWHDQTPEVEMMLEHDIPAMMKAAVPALDSLGAASPLAPYTIAANEFIELLRPATIIGRIPGLRRVPFNIQMPRTTTGSSVGWVGESAPKPVSGMAFDTVQLRWAKAAGIVVLTEELVRVANPAAEGVVRQDMIEAMAQFLDRQFLDPTVAAVPNVSPASVTNGVTPITATGTTAAAFFADVRALFAGYYAANMTTAGGLWLMTQTQALALSLIQNTLGQQVFPLITADGGTLLGYPVVTSENIPAYGSSPVQGTPIVFLVPREIMLADDGQVVIDASNQASVQMDTAPDSPPSGTTSLVSLWQMNMVGLRAERWINWQKRRPAAVQYIQNALYTG
jgi:HK97 family phage major capsid protein/HK97 family phage prohead protease